MRSLAFALAAFALALTGTSAASAPGRLEFELLRNGHPDGRHVVTVTEIDGVLNVRTQINIAVRIGPLTVYSYQHNCTETWNAGALNSLTCSTNTNGRRTSVAARRTTSSLQVTGTRGANAFPLSALPTSWWVRPPTETRSMIDTQTGEPLRVRVERVGHETLTIGGRAVEAEHLRVIGTMTVDLWYDTQGRWIGCAFTTQGQRFVYRLVSPVESGPVRA